MLTRKTAVLAFGALALSPSPSGVEGFTSSGRPIVRRSGARGSDGPSGQRRSSGMRSILTTSSPKTPSLPLPLLQSPSPSYSCSLPGNTLGRRSSGNNRVSSWRLGSQRDRKLQLHAHKQQQQQQQQQMQMKGQRRRRRGASLTKVGMALSTGAPSSAGVTSLDDHSYVAAITGGVPVFMEAMEQSLSGDLVTVVTYMPWCRSCHHLRHHLRMIAKAYAIAGSGSMFYEIDLDANREVHKMLDINAAPTVLLYSSGQLVDEFTCAGASGPKVLLRHIEEQIGAVPALRDVDTSSPAPASPTPGTTGDIPLNSNTENAEQ